MPVSAVIKDAGKGVNKDLLPSELDPGVWSDALNMRFRNGFALRRGGIQAAFQTPEEAPYAVVCYGIPETRYIIRAGLTAVYADDGSSSTDISPVGGFTGGVADRWDLSSFNGILIANNGVDDPCYWGGDPSDDLAILDDWTTGDTAIFLKPFKNFLLAGGPTLSGITYPHNLMWSDAAEPGAIPASWTPSSTNQAGSTPQMSETAGAIVDGLPLGDLFIVYKQDARFGVQFIGGNDVFRVFRLPGSDGLFAKGCVVDTPVGHVYMSAGDIRVHNGGESRSIAEGRIRQYVFDNMDPANGSRSFLVASPEKNEVRVCFPSTGSSTCDKAVVWNWISDTWAIDSLPNLTCGCTGLIPTFSAGDAISAHTEIIDTATGLIVTQNFNNNKTRVVVCSETAVGLSEVGTTDFGSTYTGRLEKTGISFGDSDSVKAIRASRPQLDASDGTQVTAYHGTSMIANGAPTYAASGAITAGATNWLNRFSVGGRYMAVKYEFAADASLRSVDVDFVVGGRY